MGLLFSMPYEKRLLLMRSKKTCKCTFCKVYVHLTHRDTEVILKFGQNYLKEYAFVS
jgi:hypothetical protein